MKKIVYSLLSFVPVLAFAQDLTNLTAIVTFLRNTLKTLIPMAFGVAILYFFWGVAKYISNISANPAKAAEGRNIMLYGVIAIAVMGSIWGLTAYLRNIFGVGDGTGPEQIKIPTVTGLN